jgi:hypothetical protein
MATAGIWATSLPTTLPPDITPEYLAQSRDQSPIIAILFVCTLTFLVMLLRIFARVVHVKKFGLDDALAIVSTVSSLFLTFL